MEEIIKNKKEIIITGNRIKLVSFTDQHLQDPHYLMWLRDYDIVKFINRREYLQKISFDDVKEYIKNIRASKRDIFFAIEILENNRFIGTFKIADIDIYTKKAGLGVLIGDKSLWGSGLASEAISLGIDFCFNIMGLHKICGGCIEPNTGMKKIFEKLGFSKEGHFKEHDLFEGRYIDHIHYGLLRKDYHH
ncbi:GNAT family N-acetyltransferase [Candidatus Woesearchaeota archaeon]|nr:GNAT family N-acetyltransferase [Candidatus Woesearchaeota archaeon]